MRITDYDIPLRVYVCVSACVHASHIRHIHLCGHLPLLTPSTSAFVACRFYYSILCGCHFVL